MQFRMELLPQILETIFFFLLILLIQSLPAENDLLKKVLKIKMSAYALLLIVAMSLAFIEPTFISRLLYMIVAFVLAVVGIAMLVQKRRENEI